jgi:hypothetical protein
MPDAIVYLLHSALSARKNASTLSNSASSLACIAGRRTGNPLRRRSQITIMVNADISDAPLIGVGNQPLVLVG